MISRYNPQQIATKVISCPVTHDIAPQPYLGVVKQRGWFIWNGLECWSRPYLESFSVTSDIAAEYGYDALSIASITAGNLTPTYELLESAYRWLAKVYEYFVLEDNIEHLKASDQENQWSVWLSAAFTAKDHLILRNRPYAALASIKKAWKQTSADQSISYPCLCLIASLLFPFAPILSRHFLERLNAWPPLSLENLTSEFHPYKPVRVALERGGWNWVVVNADQFNSKPELELSKITWISQAFNSVSFKVSEEKEGWRLCRNRQLLNVDNS